jgi:hypothetical protein
LAAPMIGATFICCTPNAIRRSVHAIHFNTGSHTVSFAGDTAPVARESVF